MNFVIFSKNFYPQNDAEAFCTTRFASALAEAGHMVHVVTVEYACDFDYKVLLDERVKITRVRVGRKMPIPFQVNLRPMMVLDRDMRSISECCRAVKHVLREYERPILITRAMPLHSAVVGIRTHKYAYKWISHFSDPIPWFKIDNKLLQLKDWLTRRLIKKAIAQADAISVTCPLAIRYYKEAYASASVGKHFFVTTHIGDCKLDSKQDVTHETVFTRRVILHPGDMYFGRGDLIFKAVDALNELGEKCFFVLDRPPFPDMVHWFRESGNVISLGVRGGGALNMGLNATASVVFVPDFNREFDYSPYLMSKFVYQVYGDRPIVVYAKKESCMADYCRKYPEAGLFFAEMDNIEALVSALRAAFKCNPVEIQREAIRNEFSAQVIARRFEQDVKACCEIP